MTKIWHTQLGYKEPKKKGRKVCYFHSFLDVFLAVFFFVYHQPFQEPSGPNGFLSTPVWFVSKKYFRPSGPFGFEQNLVGAPVENHLDQSGPLGHFYLPNKNYLQRLTKPICFLADFFGPCSNPYFGLSGPLGSVQNLVGTPLGNHLDQHENLGHLYQLNKNPFPSPSGPIWILYNVARLVQQKKNLFWPIWTCGHSMKSYWDPCKNSFGPNWNVRPSVPSQQKIYFRIFRPHVEAMMIHMLQLIKTRKNC